MSYASDETDKRLIQLEKKISAEYGKAYKEMDQAWKNYIKGYDEFVDGKKVHHAGLQERYLKEYEAYQNGKYTDAEFKQWYQTQIERGKGYEKLAESLTNRAVNADQVASAYINDITPSIYSLNANYNSYSISSALNAKGVEADFQLMNEQAVKELMQNSTNFTEFKTVKINPKRDYEWNSDQIRSALSSGIMQGKSIDKLTDGFMEVMKRDRASAIRNARTAVTSAENGGRMASAKQAEKMGIKIRKQWHSMEDSHVRLSHELLNGETRDLDKPFSNGLMYPADSSGDPSEVYNCRCRCENILPEYKKTESIENYESTKNEGESYKAWIKRKEAEYGNRDQKRSKGSDPE